MITIGIVTFSKRFDMFKALIADIRRRTDVPIVVCVNGEMSGKIDPAYRKELLEFCASFPEVYPQLFPTFQGLAKLWNTLVINAPTEHVYILNDDVSFKCDDVIERIERHINETGSGLFYAPWGWSHFVISKAILDDLGYFDERLLGVGEEDGDMHWRFLNLLGSEPGGIEVPGVGNTYDFKRATDGLDTIYGNKTRFNAVFMYGRKYLRNDEYGLKGMLSYPVRQAAPNLPQYPYERFKWEHAQYLADASQMPVTRPIDPAEHRNFKPWVDAD